jgi:DNA-binding phage protein
MEAPTLTDDERGTLTAAARNRGLAHVARTLDLSREVTARLASGSPVRRCTLEIARQRLVRLAPSAAPSAA